MIVKNAEERVSKINAWLRAYLDESCSTTFLNKTESARRAGYKCKTEDCLRHLGCRNFIKVSDRINQWFDEAGLSENALKIKLLSLLNAKETKFFSVPIKDKNGVVTDIFVKEVDVEALETQRRALDMALKVRGMYAAKKYDHTGTILLAPAKIKKAKDAGK
jgi:phage terminase small subunit